MRVHDYNFESATGWIYKSDGGGRPLSMYRSIGGLARTLTARYYKTGSGNIIGHWDDGYATTGILEIEDTGSD